MAKVATISGAFSFGSPVEPQMVNRVELFVAGSVAVSNLKDVKYRILKGSGAVSSGNSAVTTIHDLQVVEDALPWEGWDVPVDLTSTRVIRVKDKIDVEFSRT